ncbi:MAG: glutaminyl-peptide cyclotransferase [Pseudomonadales bacterium]|nr:glutaminyl-peptide cyclotransferase [Pseudomonadales bacterium]
MNEDKMIRNLAVLAILLSGACLAAEPEISPPVRYGYEVVVTFPHDTYAFTQGLLFHEGWLYESTGLFDQSTLREVTLMSGVPARGVKLGDGHFAEGLALVDDKFYQLTWTSGRGLIFNKTDLSFIKPFLYLYGDEPLAKDKKPWGLAYNGTHLLLSDGSANIYFIDPETHKEQYRIAVHNHLGPVKNLNELEYIKGKLYANVWKTDSIAIIDVETGHVTGDIDLTDLYPRHLRTKKENELNGIAYDTENDRLYITGKRWPKLYEIKITIPHAK